MSSYEFLFSVKISSKADASLTEETTAAPLLCANLRIFHPSLCSFSNVGVLITIDTKLFSIIVKEVGLSSSALPTLVRLILFEFKNLLVPLVE